MTGRGRGRGTLARWSTSPAVGKPRASEGRAVASVQPLQSETSKSEPVDLPPFKTKEKEDSKEFDIRVTHVIDVEHFWAQLGLPGELGQFDRYLYALKEWCDKQPTWTDSSSIRVVVGQVVCVKCKSTGSWQRGQLTRISDNMVDVFYLDSGTVESLPFDNLCSNTPADITAYTPQAQYCTLGDVRPMEESWSKEANVRFVDLVSPGQKLVAHLVSNNYKLNIYLRNSNGDKISISSILIREGHAKDAYAASEESARLPWSSGQQASLANQRPSRSSADNEYLHIGDEQSAAPKQPSLNAKIEFTSFTGGSESFPTTLQYSQQLFTNKGGFLQSTVVPAPHLRWSENTENLVGSNNFDTFKRGPPSPPSGANISMKPPPGFISNVAPTSGPSLQRDSRTFAPSLHSGDRGIGRGHSAMPGVAPHYGTRPHLAGPAEFVSYSKFPDVQATNNTADVNQSEDNWKAAGKYIPPALRNRQSRDGGSFMTEQQGQSTAFTHNTALQFKGPTASGSLSLSHPQAATWQQKQVKSHSNFEPTSLQPLTESSQDKVLKAELDWQKFKFQRKVNQVFNKLKPENMSEQMPQLKRIISGSKLSTSFQGLSEILIFLQLTVERVIDHGSFGDVAQEVCMDLYGAGVPEFCEHLVRVMNDCRDELSTSYTISNCEKKCERFCSFLGELFKLAQEQDQASLLVTTLGDIIKGSIEVWLTFDEDEDKRQSQLQAFCLGEIFRIIGPGWEETDREVLESYFHRIREFVLSRSLEREVKSRLLDLLLLRTSGWKRSATFSEDDEDEEDEEASSSTVDEVLVEGDEEEEKPGLMDDAEERKCQNEEEQLDKNASSSGWDPYFRVKRMLHSLRLEALLEKFQDNCIRDTLLEVESEQLKNTLKEAGFPPGVILEMKMYLDKDAEEPALKLSPPNKGKKVLEKVHHKQAEQRNKPEQSKPKQHTDTRFEPEKVVSPVAQKASEAARKAVPPDEKPRTGTNQAISVDELNQELYQLMISQGNSPGGVETGNRSPHSQSDKLVSPPKTPTHGPSPYSRGIQQGGFESRSLRRRSSLEDKGSKSPDSAFYFPPPDVDGRMALRVSPDFKPTAPYPIPTAPYPIPTAPYPIPCLSRTTTSNTPSYSQVLKTVSPTGKSPHTWTLPSDQKAMSPDQRTLPLVKGRVPPQPGKGPPPAAEKKGLPKKGIIKPPPGLEQSPQQNIDSTSDVPNIKRNVQFKGVRFSSHVETNQSHADTPYWRDMTNEDENNVTEQRFPEVSEVNARSLSVYDSEDVRGMIWDVGLSHGERFSTPPAEAPKPIPFGLRGPKVCTLCGSASHREANCTDRSNWFLD